jgi:hypothetical protein
MNKLTLVVPFNGINHFAVILAYCSETYTSGFLTLVVEINSLIKDKKASKDDCVMLTELCLGERTLVKFADEDPSYISNTSIVESVLNIPSQARDCFPVCWKYLFSAHGKKTITGDNIGIPVVKRNPVLNIIHVYIEILKSTVSIRTPRRNYHLARELCPPLPPILGRKLGSFENTLYLLRKYYSKKRHNVFEENINTINSFVPLHDFQKSQKYEKITFLLLTNKPTYNSRMMSKCLESPIIASSFIFILPHPKAPSCSPICGNMSLVNTRGICAELLVDLIVKQIRVSSNNVTIAGSSSALLLFAHEGNYRWQIIKSHLKPLLNKDDFFRYIRLLNFEKLCLKVSNSV